MAESQHHYDTLGNIELDAGMQGIYLDLFGRVYDELNGVDTARRSAEHLDYVIAENQDITLFKANAEDYPDHDLGGVLEVEYRTIDPLKDSRFIMTVGTIKDTDGTHIPVQYALKDIICLSPGHESKRYVAYANKKTNNGRQKVITYANDPTELILEFLDSATWSKLIK